MRKYLVALQTGGIMEMPAIEYCDFQIIEAENPTMARMEYNNVNNCQYFYGSVIAEIPKDVDIDEVTELISSRKGIELMVSLLRLFTDGKGY